MKLIKNVQVEFYLAIKMKHTSNLVVWDFFLINFENNFLSLLLLTKCLTTIFAFICVNLAKTDPEFKAFLAKRNPRQQHSSTLESYLIKPIQRVLKYPLLLRELYGLTDPESEEHYHLNGKYSKYHALLDVLWLKVEPAIFT